MPNFFGQNKVKKALFRSALDEPSTDLWSDDGKAVDELYTHFLVI